MKNLIEKDRFIIRKIQEKDLLGIFDMESDPDVHQFLGKKPMLHISEAEEQIRRFQKQYADYGIGRWAIINPHSEEFMGWTGFKFMDYAVNGHIGYYDFGYRLRKKYWGRGLATATGHAVLKYGFSKLGFEKIYAMAEYTHHNSIKVLIKVGMQQKEIFDSVVDHYWFSQEKKEWLNKNKNRIL